jgi:plasmid stabilization system protein ParE
MFTINLTPLAKEDIESIIDYIEKELFAPLAAANFFRGIYAKIKELEITAAVYAKSTYQDVLIYGNNARHVSYKGFVVIYTIHTNRVVVHRIVHSSLIKT